MQHFYKPLVLIALRPQRPPGISERERRAHEEMNGSHGPNEMSDRSRSADDLCPAPRASSVQPTETRKTQFTVLQTPRIARTTTTHYHDFNMSDCKDALNLEYKSMDTVISNSTFDLGAPNYSVGQSLFK